MESAQTDEIYAESEPRAMKRIPIVMASGGIKLLEGRACCSMSNSGASSWAMAGVTDRALRRRPCLRKRNKKSYPGVIPEE